MNELGAKQSSKIYLKQKTSVLEVLYGWFEGFCSFQFVYKTITPPITTSSKETSLREWQIPEVRVWNGRTITFTFWNEGVQGCVDESEAFSP